MPSLFGKSQHSSDDVLDINIIQRDQVSIRAGLYLHSSACDMNNYFLAMLKENRTGQTTDYTDFVQMCRGLAYHRVVNVLSTTAYR
jgi:hypothetical protein